METHSVTVSFIVSAVRLVHAKDEKEAERVAKETILEETAGHGFLVTWDDCRVESLSYLDCNK